MGTTTIGKTGLGTTPTPSYGSLEEEIKKLNAHLSKQSVFRIGEEQGWKFEEADKSVVFSKRVTLATTPNNFDIYIPYPFYLGRIEMGFSTTNVKTIAVRQYSSDYVSSYIQILSSVAEAGSSIQHIADQGYRCKSFTKFSIIFSDFTDGEIIDIQIYIEKVI